MTDHWVPRENKLLYCSLKDLQAKDIMHMVPDIKNAQFLCTIFLLS